MSHPARALSLLLLVLAAPARATIENPPSGTPFSLGLGGWQNIKLKNAGGCTFDFMAMAADPGIVSFSREAGTDLKGATIAVEAIGVGSTTITVMSFNGTCPPAMHTYPVTVEADWKALAKDFDTLAKDEFKEFKLGVTLAFKDYSAALSGLNVQYKDGALDDEGLQDGFHVAAVDLRRAWTVSAALSYADVVGGGTQILADAAAEYGDAPNAFFAGGCGSFDWFQDSVCSKGADFHDAFDKASKKGIKAFEKSGAPVLGQWNAVPPLYSGGPLYPVQAMDFPLPQQLTGPLSITTMPARNEAGDDGRVLVSGPGVTALSGQLEVSLTWFEVGQAPVVMTQTPDIVDDEWSAEFGGLMAGAYLMATRYTGDESAVELPITVLRTQFSF
jgi:hypothetical protein